MEDVILHLIVVDGVVAPVLFSPHVDVVEVDGGDAPEVACNDIVTKDGFVVGASAVDGDAAATVHGVVFVVVVNELISNDDR